MPLATVHRSGEIAEYVARQCSALFPIEGELQARDLSPYLEETLHRAETCFSRICSPSYFAAGTARLDLLHSDQYCSLLYLLANTAHRSGASSRLCAKLFCLNKALHGFNCMWDTDLPEVFWLVHCVGTVLGKAGYSNFLVVHQACTVGAMGGEYPSLGECVNLSAGASIVGPCHIGSNVIVAPGCSVVKQDVPPNTLVQRAGELQLKPISDRGIRTQFRLDAAG